MQGSDWHSANQVTDDDVFKELINIVMDVFSSKSEKCLLTFELPVETSMLKEITQEITVENCAGASHLKAPESGNSVPPKGSNLSQKLLRRRRRRKALKKKSSKLKIEKKRSRRLNPVVRSALQPKQGFTELGRPLWMHLQQSSVGRRYEEERSPESDTNRCNSCDRDEDTDDKPKLHRGDTKSLLFRLCSEFEQVLRALTELAHSQQPIPGKMSLGDISHHLEGIQYHVAAMKNSLMGFRSKESVDTPQPASTEGSETPRRNKVGVRLIRVGAKISRKNTTITQYPKKQRKRKTKTRDVGLKDILRNYQRVKKEETEIVQVLLRTLGLRNGQSNHKCRKRRLRRPKREISDRPSAETAEASDMVTALLTERGQTTRQNLDVGMINQDMQKDPQNGTSFDSKSQQTEVEDDRNNKPRSKYKQKHAGKGRKHEKSDANRRLMEAYNTNHSPIILYEYQLPVFSKRSERMVDKSLPIKQGMKRPKELRSIDDKMMHQIESAAKKLEYMHGQMEKKLTTLGKQQKELNRKISERIADTPRGSRSNLSEQPKGKELMKDFNSSTNIDELYKPHEDGKRFGEAWHEEPKRGEYEPTMVEETSCKNETLENEHAKAYCASDQSFICNYMMELQDKKTALDPEVSSGTLTADTENKCEQQNQQSITSGNNHGSSIVLNNEFPESRMAGEGSKDSLTSTIISITTREIEGEITEESLFDSPNSFRPKPRKSDARKKRRRVVHTPLCALS